MNQPWIFKECVHGSGEYRQCLGLRDRILRKPLGLGLSKEQIAAEIEDSHLGVFDSSHQLAGCLVLSWPKDQLYQVKMRQVAISEERQRSGLGSQLTQFAESFALEKCPDIRLIYCHARENAVPFYERLGYEKRGDPFEEVGLVHFRMEKPIR